LYGLVVTFGIAMCALAANASTTIGTTIQTGGQIYASSTVMIAATYGIDTDSAGALNIGTTTATSVIIGSATAKVGIASTSPYVALGVTGTTTATLGNVIGSAGTGISQLTFGTCTLTMPAISASSTAVANCTATGSSNGDKVFVTLPQLPVNIIFTGASSTAANTIQIAEYNTGITGGATTPPAVTVSWLAIH